MKNKISVILTIALLFATVNFPTKLVFAASEILVEGENYSKIGYSPVRIDKRKNDMSGGAALLVETRQKAGDVYEIAYDVNIPETGDYNIFIKSSKVSAGWTNDYAVSVNGGEPLNAADGRMVSELNTPSYPGVFAEYGVGPLYLNKGNNEIKFIVDLNDTRDDGLIIFYLDCFSLEMSKTGINSFESAGVCGVYEKNKDVVYNISFGSANPDNATYDFVVTDFWDNEVLRNTIQCGRGLKKYDLNLGKFETGWYKLRLYTGGTDKLEREVTFAVVPPLNERVEGDTPFATDFASSMLVTNINRLKNLAQTLKYAGITYARERYSWNDGTHPAKDTYNFEDTQRRAKIFADQGIQVSQMFASTPSWTNMNNLFDIYEFQKAMAAEHKDTIQTLEVWNEQDGGFAQVSADTYSSFYKAAALGIKDSGANTKVGFGGFCTPLDKNVFIDLMIKNDVSRYSDFYNAHGHVLYNGDRVQDIRTSYLQGHRELKIQYAQNQPYWMTEAGLAMPVGDDGIPTNDELMAQARYSIISTTEALATGVSKFFWFIWPQYNETGNEWGVFDKNDNPNPSYASEAVMTYMLGKGIYKGSLQTPDVEGYVFDNGKNDVLVAWTELAKPLVLKSDKDVRVTDIMGQEKVVKSKNGEVRIEVSYYPTYISFDTEMPISEYYPAHYNFDETPLTYNDAERVILQQNFENQDQAVVKHRGYELKIGQDENMTVTLYNFNDKEMTGTLRGELEGFDVVIPDNNVKIAAMSSVAVPVTLIPKDNAVTGELINLKFIAEFDGQETSPTVSYVRLKDTKGIEPTALFEGADKAEAWDVTNIISGSTAETEKQEDGSVEFKLNFTGTGGSWFYPYLKVPDTSVLKDTDGIVFWAKAANKDIVGEGNFNVFAYLTDGRQYFLGDGTSYYYPDDWEQYKIPWSDFILQYSPFGIADIRDFDVSLIDHMSIGTNTYQSKVNYYIKDFGYYVEEDKEETDILFGNLESMKQYRPQDLSNVIITVPQKDFKKITVMLTDEIIEPVSVSQDKVHLDLSKVPKGDYTLHIVCEDKYGYKTTDSMRFFIAP